jgi:hypothetical protein
MPYVADCIGRIGFISLTLLLLGTNGRTAQLRPADAGPTDVIGLWERDTSQDTSKNLCMSIDQPEGSGCKWMSEPCPVELLQMCSWKVDSSGRVRIDLDKDSDSYLEVTRGGNKLEGSWCDGECHPVTMLLQNDMPSYY